MSVSSAGPRSPAPAKPSAEETHPFRMSLTLNVLNDLGLRLYSHLPAVLAEVVANSWDADAEHVDIQVAADNSQITLTDDGSGMNRSEVNDRYLTVGFQRRENGGTTPNWKRPVMGRKGIGKLSLFSVAREVEVHTAKDGDKSAFRMRTKEIEAAIKAEGTYFPEPIDYPGDGPTRGTRIVLRDLKKHMRGEKALRKRIARWFSIIGPQHHFEVAVNGSPVTIEDRGYWSKIEFVWSYGKKGEAAANLCTHAKRRDSRSSEITVGGTKYEIWGWIGTVELPRMLKDDEGDDDNLNRVVLMVRDRLAEENLLARSTEAGVFTRYMLGEIHADYLDQDDKDDIATTNRQNIIEDDPRYQALVEFFRGELRYIEGKWGDLRNDEGTRVATSFPKVQEWYSNLKVDQRRAAEQLFGKINRIPVNDESERRTLVRHSILAFERLQYQGRLDDLGRVSAGDLAAFTAAFGQLDEIEASLYREIVVERLGVIRTLKEKVDADARERVLQEHLFDHLWLLDPAWERATDAPAIMEEAVAKSWEEVYKSLTEDQRKGRLDIQYKTMGGVQIIVELKRASVKPTTTDLLEQVNKYRNALDRVLRQHQIEGPIQTVIVLGDLPPDWSESARAHSEGLEHLRVANSKVITYAALIDQAQAAYQAFVDRTESLGRLESLIRSLEDPVPASTSAAHPPAVAPAPASPAAAVPARTRAT
jgi:hypothetical protein